MRETTWCSFEKMGTQGESVQVKANFQSCDLTFDFDKTTDSSQNIVKEIERDLDFHVCNENQFVNSILEWIHVCILDYI